MFLSAYHFDGDPAELRAGHAKLLESFPPEILELHICVERAEGLTVYDACPSHDVFVQFHAAPDFGKAVAAAGLPPARIEPLGDVVTAIAAPGRVEIPKVP